MSDKDDGKFLKLLVYDNERKKYLKAKKVIGRIVKQRYRRNKENNKLKHQNEIETSRRHMFVMNAAISPFTDNGELHKKTGYEFIRASPLFEKHVQNMDFLLYNGNKKIIIVGECKGSIRRHTDVINQTKKRIKVFNKPANLKLVKEKYLSVDSQKKLRVEFVLVVPSKEAPDTATKIQNSDGELILWHTPLAPKAGEGNELKIVKPSNKLEKSLVKSMLHNDKKLNQELKSAKTGEYILDIFPQMHKFHELQSILNVERSGVITRKDLKAYIQQNLYYMDKRFITKKVNSILKGASDCGFIKKITDERYELRFTGRRETIESRMERVWIDHQIEKEMEKDIEKEIKKLQKNYLKKGKQKTLDEMNEKKKKGEL